ncbi:hypothetical protein MNL76_07755 [Fervidobacterium riparium]|nr:hypothetical protein IB67_07530 [Fervidobacterium riparium]
MKWYLRITLAVFLSLIMTVTFAEGTTEHTHAEGEECTCEVLDSREIDVSQEQPDILLDTHEELYQKISELEELVALLYELADAKLSVDDFYGFSDFTEERLNELEAKVLNIESLSANLEDVFVTLDIHDGDILKIYDLVGTLSDKLLNIEDAIADKEKVFEELETLSLRIDMHDQDIVNIFDILSTKADATQVEELASKIETLELIKEFDFTAMIGRIALLEEYTNIIYEIVGSKPSFEDVEDMLAPLKTEGMNSLSDRMDLLEEYVNMVYDATSEKPSVEEVQDMISPLKDDIADLSSKLSALSTKFNSQEIDILKLYNSVSKLAEEVQKLAGKVSLLETMIRDLNQRVGK